MLTGKRSRALSLAAAALLVAAGPVFPQAPFLSYDFEDGRLDDFFSPRGGAALVLCGAPDLFSTGPVRAEAGEVVLDNGGGSAAIPSSMWMFRPEAVRANFPSSRSYRLQVRFRLESLSVLGLYLRTRMGINEAAGTVDLSPERGYALVVAGARTTHAGNSPEFPNGSLGVSEVTPCGGIENARDEWPGVRFGFGVKTVDPGVAILQRTWYRLEASVHGNDQGGPVHIAARIWRDGDPRPPGPQIAVVDPDGIDHTPETLEPGAEVQVLFWTSWDIESIEPGGTCRLDDLVLTEISGCKDPPLKARRRLWEDQAPGEGRMVAVHEPGREYAVRLDLSDIRAGGSCGAPAALRIAERVPPFWEVRDVSHGGQVSGGNIEWLLDPADLVGGSASLTYKVVAHRRGIQGFNGTVEEEGSGLSFPIEGDNTAASQERLPAMSDFGSIQRWLTLGPFEFAGAPTEAELVRDHLSDCATTEAGIRPRAGDTIRPDFGGCAASTGLLPNFYGRNPGGTPTWLEWHDFDDYDDRIAFDSIYGDVEQVVSYAVTYIQAAEDLRVNFGVSSDDSVHVLLDGRDLHRNNVLRNANARHYYDSPFGTPPFPALGGVELEAGIHTVLVKVFDFGFHQDFRVGFLDDAGRPIPGGPDGIRILLSPEAPFRRADADGSGTLDLSDAVFTLTHLFRGGDAPGCMDAADADDSGQLDISDPIYTLSHLFRGGPPPPAPGPGACGDDPTREDPPLPDCAYPAAACGSPCKEPPASATRRLWQTSNPVEGKAAVVFEPGTTYGVEIEISDPRPAGDCVRAERVQVVESIPPGWEVQEVRNGGRRAGSAIIWDVDLTAAPLSPPSYTVTAREALPARFEGEVREEGSARWSRVSGPDLAVMQAHIPPVSDAGGIQRWLILGPLQRAGGADPGLAEIRRDYLTDGSLAETSVRPRAGDTIRPDYGGAAASTGLAPDVHGRNPGGVPTWIAWTAIDDGTDWIDFAQVYGVGLNIMLHALTYLEAAEDTVVNLGVSSDDSVQVLLDGVEIHANSVARMGLPNGYQDSPFSQPAFPGLGNVPIRKGKHVLLVKVFNGLFSYNFLLGFLDDQGKPIPGGPPGITFSLEP